MKRVKKDTLRRPPVEFRPPVFMPQGARLDVRRELGVRGMAQRAKAIKPPRASQGPSGGSGISPEDWVIRKGVYLDNLLAYLARGGGSALQRRLTRAIRCDPKAPTLQEGYELARACRVSMDALWYAITVLRERPLPIAQVGSRVGVP
jgi:hypothetical protein